MLTACSQLASQWQHGPKRWQLYRPRRPTYHASIMTDVNNEALPPNPLDAARVQKDFEVAY